MKPDIHAMDKWQKLMLILCGGVCLHTGLLNLSQRGPTMMSSPSKIMQYTRNKPPGMTSNRNNKRTEIVLKGL